MCKSIVINLQPGLLTTAAGIMGLPLVSLVDLNLKMGQSLANNSAHIVFYFKSEAMNKTGLQFGGQ